MGRIAALTCAVVMLAPAFGAAAAAADVVPVQGPWHATTSAGLPVSFEVSGGQVVNLDYRFRWGFCGSSDVSSPGGIPIEASGHWTYHNLENDTVVDATFVSPDRAEGTVTAPSRMTPGCPETRAGFVAEPGPAPPPPRTFVLDDVRSGHLAEAPRRMVLAGGRVKIFELDDWFEFGEPRSVAGGRALLRRCRHCRHPEVRRPQAVVRLDRLGEEDGYRVYERIRWFFRGPIPRGFARHGSYLLR